MDFDYITFRYRPAISTEGGGLKFSSPGNLVFEAGAGGTVQFMTADGQEISTGQKGEMVRMVNWPHMQSRYTQRRLLQNDALTVVSICAEATLRYLEV